jgi:hypothetical protein
MDKRVERVEALLKQVEEEKNFLRAADLFTEAAPIIKELLAEGEKKHGRVFEVIKEIDKFVEKELKEGEED